MSGDGDQSSEGRLPLDRRDFIQLSLGGAVLDGYLTDKYAETVSADTASGVSPGGAATSSLRPPPSARRAYFPVVADHVSVGGLAPPESTSVGSAVRLSDGRFSVSNLASEYNVDREPTSVRELTTPQRTGPEPNPTQKTWENWLEDYTNENAEDFTLSGSDSAQRQRLLELVVRKADDKFRGVGSGHSHSEAARPEKFYSDLKNARGMLAQPWLRDSGDQFWDDNAVVRENLVRLQAGTTIKRLNRGILDDTDLALPNMGSWDGQTLAGAVNTSTHGTGLGLGSFADLVRSVEIVTVPESQYESGEEHIRMFRIEPTDGITDPKKFPKDAGEHDMVLIQDDDIFYSTVVGYGSMGIVYAYTFELRKDYWLREKNTIQRLNSFDPVALAKSVRHLNFNVDLIEPQLNGTTNPNCLVRTRTTTRPNGDPVKPDGRDPTERANVGNAIEQIIDQFLTSWQQFDDFKDLRKLANQIGDTYERLLSIDILDLAGYDPPFVDGRDETAWYIALRRKKETNPDPTVPPEPPTDTITTEVGVPVDQVKPAIQEVIRFVQQEKRFFPAPLGVRFTNATEHFFAPEYQRPTAMLEFIIPQPSKLQEEISKVKIKKSDNPLEIGPIETTPKGVFFQKLKKISFETGRLGHFLQISEAKKEMRKIQEKLVKEFDGRPHMGKFNTVHVTNGKPYMRPQNMYPEYEKWVDSYEYFSRFGTFEGRFTDNKVRS
jgi:hypothetical protein